MCENLDSGRHHTVVCFCSSITGTENCFLGGSLFYSLLIWNYGVYYEPIDPWWINKAGWKNMWTNLDFQPSCTVYVLAM